ncbi:hypothetical protein KKC60_05295, partial [Patescibacteria group bacterium]|nr:hypothetical protein [Patescibacteria group bacterium]
MSKTTDQHKNKKNKKNDPQKKAKRKKRLKIALLIIGILIVLGLLAVVGIFIYFAKDLPSPDKINKRDVAESTKIFARDGETLLYEVHG